MDYGWTTVVALEHPLCRRPPPAEPKKVRQPGPTEERSLGVPQRDRGGRGETKAAGGENPRPLVELNVDRQPYPNGDTLF